MTVINVLFCLILYHALHGKLINMVFQIGFSDLKLFFKSFLICYCGYAGAYIWVIEIKNEQMIIVYRGPCEIKDCLSILLFVLFYVNCISMHIIFDFSQVFMPVTKLSLCFSHCSWYLLKSAILGRNFLSQKNLS